MTEKKGEKVTSGLEQTLETALEQFPTIKQIITLEKVLELLKNDPYSLFIYNLSKSNPKISKLQEMIGVLKKDPTHVGAMVILYEMIKPFCMMKYLDSFLEAIKDEDKLSKYIAHLTEKNSFLQGYSEIEVAANLKKIFGAIELEPKLANGKSVDVKFLLGSGEIFVEVTAPKKSQKYMEKMEESADTGNVVELEAPVERASEKIIGEIKHFSKVLEDVNSLIIINLNDTDIDDCDIEDSILGVSSLLVQTNRETREFSSKVIRGDWNAFSRDHDLGKIGAVICYKRDFALNGEIVYTKKLFVMSFEEAKYQPLTKLF